MVLCTLPKLKNNNTIVFGCIVGSHAYGTNVEGSDLDKKWVYVQSPMDLFINGYRPQIEIGKDEVVYELSRFLELAQKANPTILELFFAPKDTIIYQHPSFDLILDLRKSFLTKACRFSFGGYAISQIEKAKGLDKHMNWEKERTERKTVLDFCYWILQGLDPKHEGNGYQTSLIKNHFKINEISKMGLAAIPHTRGLYNLFYDVRYPFKGIVQNEETANDISLSEIPKDANDLGMLYFNKDAYQIHCREYNEYQTWLKNRNTQRYIDIENHGQMIDGKNMLHCIRLIETALDIATFGELLVRRDNAAFLIEVRKGKHNLQKILEHCQLRIEQMEYTFEHCDLPNKFEGEAFVKMNNYKLREQIAKEVEASKQLKSNY